MSEISYDMLKEEAIQFSGAQDVLVLATAANDRVTVRTILCVNSRTRIFRYTSINSHSGRHGVFQTFT